MDMKKLKRISKSALNIATDIIPKIPNKDDTPLAVIVKLMGIVDSMRKITSRGNAAYAFFEMLDVDEITNGQFVDLFFETSIHETFEARAIELSDYQSIKIFEKKGYGVLYFTEYRWGRKPEVSDDFWASPDFPFNRVMECLWELFDGQIHIEAKADPSKNRPRALFSPMPPIVDPIIGCNAELLERLKKRYERFIEENEQCTYLFLGKQGAGKTTMAQRVAQHFGGRCIRIDAGGLTEVGVRDLDFLLRQLQPNFLIVDDIDKCATVAAVLPTLLSLLSDLRSKHPNLTTILTAATTTGLDPALVRPRRIDKIVEFELPNEEERHKILFEYGVLGPVLRKLAKSTEGLTAAYLQGIAAQIRCGDHISEVMDDIERMKKLAVQPAAALSGPALENGVNKAING
jgi:ATPase family associated with various cellular activities (AAA)